MNAASRALQTALLFSECIRERRVPYYPPEKLRDIQTRRLRSIVKYAYDNVPYYRETMRGRSVLPEDIRDASDLTKLPVISKADVRADYTAFQSRLVPIEECVLLKSTFGGACYWDPHSALHRMALLERDRVVWTRLARLRPGHTRLVLVPTQSAVVAQRNFLNTKILQPRLWARRVYHDPSLPFGSLVDTLERVRPEIAFSYGSTMEHFFRFLRGSGTRPAHLPRLWAFSSDGLDPVWRDIIEREYGVIVYSTYAATEMGRIGYECEKQMYHLNADALAIRVIDAEGRDVPAGENGEICISNLLNRGTVLLNYRIEDFGSLSEANCDCGRRLPVMREFHGKVSAGFMKLADGTETLARTVLRPLLAELVPALKYQIVIEGQGAVTLRIVLAAGAPTAGTIANIERKARDVYGDNLRVAVEVVDDIETGKAVKFPRVVREDDTRAETAPPMPRGDVR